MAHRVTTSHFPCVKSILYMHVFSCTSARPSLRIHDEHFLTEKPACDQEPSHELQLNPSNAIGSPTTSQASRTLKPHQEKYFGTTASACQRDSTPSGLQDRHVSAAAQHDAVLPRRVRRKRCHVLPVMQYAACGASYHHDSCAPIVQTLWPSWQVCNRLSERVVRLAMLTSLIRCVVFLMPRVSAI